MEIKAPPHHEPLSKEWLEELYNKQHLSMKEIEYRSGIDKDVIQREIRRHGIHRGKYRTHPRDYPDSFYLKRLLVEKKKVSVVASELGVTPESIRYQLKIRDIKLPSQQPNIFRNI